MALVKLVLVVSRDLDMIRMRILLVDDTDLLREMMQRALENKHFEVISASNV
jgi:CheY-like chemotaxis protein